MKSKPLLFGLVMLGAGLGLYYEVGRLAETDAGVPPVDVAQAKKHRVTADMEAASNRKTKQIAPDFRAEASDGETYALSELVKSGPLVLVFIKSGCPCSEDAEPHFKALHAAFDGWVRFFGVIDGDTTVAAAWAADHGTSYPILGDPDLNIIHAYEVSNSAWVALIGRDGRIDKLWPGFSVSMLRELRSRISALSGRTPQEFDPIDAPENLYSGCPF